MPVSYTHLDVYKRQGYCRGAWRAVRPEDALLKPGCGGSLPGDMPLPAKANQADRFVGAEGYRQPSKGRSETDIYRSFGYHDL